MKAILYCQRCDAVYELTTEYTVQGLLPTTWPKSCFFCKGRHFTNDVTIRGGKR